MTSLLRIFVVGIVSSTVGFATYAYASSNSGTQVAGEAAVPISGWDMSNLSYQLSDDPRLVQAITFDLNTSADNVSARLDSTGSFTNCINTAGFHWECSFPGGVQVSRINEIRVVAIGN